jgi:hypothetical protein
MAINLSDNIKVKAPKSNDSRYLSSINVIPFPQPYSADTEVYATIPVGERYIGLTVNINNEEWWFENDVNILTLKSSSADIQNVGDGEGLIYSGSSGSTAFLRSLRASGDTVIETNGDEIIIFSSGATGGNVRDVEFITTGLEYTATTSSDYIGISGAVTQVYMPITPLLGQQVTISDDRGLAESNPITIDGNGNKINSNYGPSSPLTPNGLVDTTIINSDYGSLTLLYNGSFWKIISFAN